MTTCAWNGEFVAADTLGDQASLRIYNSKIYQNDRIILMGAGVSHENLCHWRRIKDASIDQILAMGYPDYDSEKGNNAMILVDRKSKSGWMLTGSEWMEITRPFHAIGSGRDFALAAMRLGCEISEAVSIAAEFDIYTGGIIETVRV